MSPVFTRIMYTGISNGKRKLEQQEEDGDEIDSSLVVTLIVEDVKIINWSTKATKFCCQLRKMKAKEVVL